MVDQRAATVFFGCCWVSVVAGALTLLAAESWPVAILTAGAAFGGALPLLNSVIKDNLHGNQASKDD